MTFSGLYAIINAGLTAKQAKKLACEALDISIQQWTDQSVRFQAASGDESEREQSVGQKGANDPMAGDRASLCGAVHQPQRECSQAAASDAGRLHHSGGIRIF